MNKLVDPLFGDRTVETASDLITLAHQSPIDGTKMIPVLVGPPGKKTLVMADMTNRVVLPILKGK